VAALVTSYRSLSIQTVIESGMLGPGFALDANWHMNVQVAVPDGLGGTLLLTPPSDDVEATLVGWFADQFTSEDGVAQMLFYIVLSKSGAKGRRLLWHCIGCKRTCETLYCPRIHLVSGESAPFSWKCRRCYQLQYPRAHAGGARAGAERQRSPRTPA
jgi:hypothetical protein